MDREEIFENVNRMCSILENIYDNDLLDYCLSCLNDNDYASVEGFLEFKGIDEEDEEDEDDEEDEEDDE